jgi:gamma-glutamyltranspeptidase/glutathione hydrolase
MTVAERGSQDRAPARLLLFDGPNRVESTRISVPPAASVVARFVARLHGVRVHHLRVEIRSARAEVRASNNGARIDVTVHRYDADGVVSTDHRLATQAAVRILRAGGNAIDAAAAVAFALNVVNPNLSGIGGGANILVRFANGRSFALDGREAAPGATTPTMYRGKTVAAVGVNGYSVGVPGMLRAVDLMLKRWGTMTLGETLQPATELADRGIPVGAFLASSSADARVLDLQPETIALMRRADGSPLQQGDILVQHDLAKTFRLIAHGGSAAFYRGAIAAAIVDAQHRRSPTRPIVGGEGRMTLDDLARYDAKVAAPIALSYRGYRVLGAPPSTCGGLVVLEALGLLQASGLPIGDPAAGYGFGQTKTLHALLEALRLGLADRDMWIGDSALVRVPVRGLLSPGYLAARSKLISVMSRIPEPTPVGDPFSYQPDYASRTGVAADEVQAPTPHGHTTHFSIIDKNGTVVSFTSTVTDGFGSGILVPGYGFLLNDGLSNFNLTPRANAATGNPGANDPAPYKRDMGNLAPTILVRNGEAVAATGTYGSDFIPSIVLGLIVDLIDHHMTLQQAVDAPRMWVADARGDAAVNVGISQETIDAMRALGDRVSRNPAPRPALGSLSSVAVDGETFKLEGAADRSRIPEASAVVLRRR